MNLSLEQARFRGIVQKLPGTPVLPTRLQVNVPRAAMVHLLALALASVSLAVVLFRFSSYLESLGNWRYLGVAAAEFGNSAMMIFPTPASAYTFAMGAALNPILVGLIGGVAATVGEMIGYYIGWRSNSVIANRPVIQRFSEWTDRWGIVGTPGLRLVACSLRYSRRLGRSYFAIPSPDSLQSFS